MSNHITHLRTLLSLFVTGFLLVSSACTLPAPFGSPAKTSAPTNAPTGAPTATQGVSAGLSPAILTQAAATIQAEFEQMNAQAAATEVQLTAEAPAMAEAPPTLPPTSTPLPPTATLAPTSTPLPTEMPLPTNTPKPTVSFPRVRAFTDTNCRQGPDKTSNVKGYLLAGSRADVFGRNGISEWWYIANPSASGYCWVSSATTEFEGDANALPILFDPTPRPENASSSIGFNIDTANLTACANGISMIFTIFNTSNVALESVSLKIDDLTTSELLFGPSAHNAPFRLSNQDCSAGGDTLWPGNAGYVGGAVNSAPFPGHTIQATIQLCSQENLQGQCYQNTIEFVVP